MKETTTLRQKISQFLYVLVPILVTQIALYSMNLFDTMMSGNVSSNDLAGVAIGSSLWVPIFTGISGILMAITPIVAQHLGANNKKEVPYAVVQGIYLSIALAIIVIILGFLFLNPILSLMNLDPVVEKIAREYLIALAIGVIPLFAYTVLRSFMDALGHTRVTMIITLLSLPINIFFNYILIFGKLGFPQLGGVGAGYASTITYICITLMAVYFIHRVTPFAEYQVFLNWFKVSFQSWKEILKIGVPSGLAIFCETSIFAAVTLLMAKFSTITIAAHQAALNFASLLYMMPLSISIALTITVGFEVGAKRFKDARSYSYLGISSGLILGVLASVILFVFNKQVGMLYTTEPEVLDLIQQFLIYAIFFQLSDAIGAPIQGALRGYKDVNVTFLLAVVSFWVIGLPLGYVLAKFTEFGPFGYWLGLIIGLASGAVFLFLRLRVIQKRTISSKTNLKIAG
ncbi:MATE family efflux transporter [Anaerobacillus arseniciselenatis]|uniref:Probable multidrug resistance protein NorM n=1 Tax=Anaerobacillus arseniciselenatis TaxID=85682 RepID=A0A1S2LTT1_9BACI|nr:MATE family efflux transporter [Anaerobacillus arseniciselenatis]OIJ15724.1 MATE family efflux transporter [Anaerobacillus arseniciselenatis]